MDENVKDRIAEFVHQKRISMSEFERRCGLSNGYVSSMRKGFGDQKLRQVLQAFPELSREWLLFGEGEMLKNIEHSIIQNIEQNHNSGHIKNSQSVTTENEKFLDLLLAKEKSLAKAQEHISQLLELLSDKK